MVRTEVRRGLEPLRLAVIGIVVSIGLTAGLSVGFGVSSALWGLLAGLGSFGLACFLLWHPLSRHHIMNFARVLVRE